VLAIRRHAEAKRYLEVLPLQSAAEAFDVPLTELASNAGT
jgi:hypothetical protein